MKRIPDCPGGMGNANDWIKAREALGYPQNRTVSYEYTTYDNSGSDAVEQIRKQYEEKHEYGEEMFDIGYDEGFRHGYKQAIEDLKKIQKTDHTPDSIKKILKETKCPLSIHSRFFEIKSIVRINENKNKRKS